MDTKETTTGAFALKFGLLAGLIALAFKFMIQFMDMLYDPSPIKSIVPIVIIAVAMFIGIHAFKKANEGFLTLSEAIKIAVGAGLISGIISILYIFVLANYMEPDMLEKSAEVTREVYKEKFPEMDEEQISSSLDMQSKFFWVTYPTLLIGNMILGLLVGLIGGLSLKKVRPNN